MKVSPDCSKVPRTAKSGKIDEEREKDALQKKKINTMNIVSLLLDECSKGYV